MRVMNPGFLSRLAGREFGATCFFLSQAIFETLLHTGGVCKRGVWQVASSVTASRATFVLCWLLFRIELIP